MFAQDNEETRRCNYCQECGHLLKDCPKLQNKLRKAEEEGEHQLMMTEGTEDDEDNEKYYFGQGPGPRLNKTWLLLDNQSSVDLFVNDKFLTNISKAASPTTVYCNAGKTICDKEGDFISPQVGTIRVKFNTNGICNIISLKTLQRRFKITYDSSQESSFCVHTPSGVVHFKQCGKGLHFLNLDKTKHPDVLCTTVQKNFEGFSRREIGQAIIARKLQGMIGHPSTTDFEGMVRNKLIEDCPIDINDIRNAHKIFGPDLAGTGG